MSSYRLGTLMRFKDITEERLCFLRSIGLDSLQLAGLKDEFLTSAGQKQADALWEMCEKLQLPALSLFISFGELNLGEEDKVGIGFAPAVSRGIRGIMACREVLWAVRHNIRQFICHAGSIPEEPAERDGFILTLRELADFIAEFDGELLLESGQEDIEKMQMLLEGIDRNNVGINFDPANLIYYGTAEPEQFLQKLRPWIKAVHCKDAKYAVPGSLYGTETPLGQGDTGFVRLLEQLISGGFDGNFVIERELPPSPEQERDIAQAVKLINSVIK